MNISNIHFIGMYILKKDQFEKILLMFYLCCNVIKTQMILFKNKLIEKREKKRNEH